MRTWRHALLLAVSLLSAAASCVHEETVIPVTQVTQVNQVSVVQPTTVHVHQGPNIDCEALCRNIATACERGCAPGAWSPNMQSIQDSCEHDCDFNEFSCVQGCRRGR
jgi:hypothetical protein